MLSLVSVKKSPGKNLLKDTVDGKNNLSFAYIADIVVCADSDKRVNKCLI
jgi:hypothetical protein